LPGQPKPWTAANDNVCDTCRGVSANTLSVGPVLYAGAETIRLLQNPDMQISVPKLNAVNSALHFKLKR
jgi:hypothetical protein